jgi:hypothetical protein
MSNWIVTEHADPTQKKSPDDNSPGLVIKNAID